MNQKKLYGRWNFWEELAGYPMMIYYWIKGEKIQKILSKRIENSKQKAHHIILTEKIKNEFLIQYEELDNFFSFHFKNIDYEFLRYGNSIIVSQGEQFYTFNSITEFKYFFSKEIFQLPKIPKDGEIKTVDLSLLYEISS